MVSTRPLISNSSSYSTTPLVTVPSAPITIGIIATFMFHNFVQFSCKVPALISLFAFLQFYPVVSWNCKVCRSSFLLTITSCGRLDRIRWSVCTSKPLRVLYASLSWTGSWLCIYHVLVWSNFNFLYNSQWITVLFYIIIALIYCIHLLLLLLFLWLLLSLSHWEFFPSGLAVGLSLKFVWQQVSTSLPDSSQYSGRSQ